VIRAEPVVAWAVGQNVVELRPYCRRMRWKLRAASASGRQAGSVQRVG
jgi:hypothetical protein